MAKKAAGKSATAERRTQVMSEVASVVFTPPSHEDIARRAFELYMARGRAEGDALADWLRAETELRTAKA